MMRSCLLWVLFLSAAAAAQSSVEGLIRDSGGSPLANVQVDLQRPDSTAHEKATTDAGGRFYFPGLPAGAYSLTAQPVGYYPATYDFVLRARQPLSLTLDAQQKTSVSQTVEVKAGYLTIDPEKTGSSYTFT